MSVILPLFLNLRIDNIMQTCIVLLMSVGLALCLAKDTDLSEKAKRFILAFASSACTDTADNCAAYPKTVCSDTTYTQWAKENCKAYCNLCSSGGGPATPPLPGASSGCSDKLTDCSAYDATACQNYQQWASENCAKTCNLCPSSQAGSGGGSGNNGVMTGTSTGCVYGGNLHKQGETWKDGCKYSCECVDGSSGKYQCRQLCLEWNLPSACHMNPPAPGKCCPQPACPPSITLQYPPGYTPQ